MARQILKRTQGPDSLPVTISDIKADLRVQDTAEDDLLNSLIAAATDFLDVPNGAIGKALVKQAWTLSVRRAGCYGRIDLPVTPVLEISGIDYYDTDNGSQTLDAADFYLVGAEDWAYIEPRPGVVWPGVYDRADAINVTFNAGFGENYADVPETIRQAIRMLVAHWYENRTAVVVGVSTAELPMAVQALINMNRKGWVA